MKQIKTKIKRGAKTKSKARRLKESVELLFGPKSKLRHLKLIKHKHTGKVIHHHHTSYLSLSVILAITGLLMFTDNYIARAETFNDTINVSLTVLGPPPTVGAVITSPSNGYKSESSAIEVSGTCGIDTYVVVKSNDLVVGTTTCNGGLFALNIQLMLGKNTLTAMNYDNANQPGPVTSGVIVFYKVKESTKTTDTPTTPSNPSIIPGISDDSISVDDSFSKLAYSNCTDFKPGDLPVGGAPQVAIVCIPRLFLPGTVQALGLLVWGGEPPYAVSIDWGDGSENTLLSIESPGYKVVSFSYAAPNAYKIITKITDAKNSTSFFEASTQVNGVIQNQQSIDNQNNSVVGSWIEASVPVYLVAVAITVGFWGGDLFDSHFGSPKKPRSQPAA